MIIVEDGSGKSDANSYVDTAGLIEYASLRALTIPSDDASLSAALIKAADYLECGVNGEYIGRPLTKTQALQWPREDFNPETRKIESLGVPAKLKQAQCILACEAANGTDLMPTITGSGFVTEETVGPITTKYDAASALSAPHIGSGLDGLLAGLISGGSGFITMRA